MAPKKHPEVLTYKDKAGNLVSFRRGRRPISDGVYEAEQELCHIICALDAALDLGAISREQAGIVLQKMEACAQSSINYVPGLAAVITKLRTMSNPVNFPGPQTLRRNTL